MKVKVKINMKNTNDVTDEMAQQDCNNNKYYTSVFRYMLGHMWIMLGTYVNLELTNLLTKCTLLIIG